MRLYYAPGACSLASHIVLRETQANFSLTRVNTGNHKLEDGSDFYRLNAKGQVPLLETDAGDLISEGPVIMQFIADQMGAHTLLPAAGSLERIRVLEWCNHLSSEIHKSFTPIFHKLVDSNATLTLKSVLKKKLAFLDGQLAQRPYLSGAQFTIADAYLFVLLNWAPFVDLDITDLPHLLQYQQRIAARPAVQAALRAEGLKS